MKTFFASLGGAVIGSILGLVLIALIGFGIVGALVSSAFENASTANSGKDSDAIVLTLDLRNGWSDQAPQTGPDAFFGNPTGFIDVLTRLESAAADDQVKGIYVRGSEFGIGSSRAEELRTAFLNFKAADKFIIAHTQGSYGGGPSGYRAIAPASELWVQAGSDLIAGGVGFETLFLKGMFDKLSVTPEFVALYEFKNSPNTYRETDYTEPHRLAMTRLANSIWDISLADISADRGMTVAEARTALESSPIGTTRMIELGLADKEGWPEDALEAALDQAGEGAVEVNISSYIPPSSPFGSPVVAIVGGQGPIVTGGAGGSLFQAGSGFASDAVAASILEAGRDEDVQAIVFRVDSPGGSPTASDQIWRAVERVQTEFDKPVVVSMGSVAASGGYYVSTGAEWIVANRSTITGSIGIFGGKFAVAEGLARIGINAESINVGGPFTGAFTSTAGFTDEQRTMMRAWLTRGYDRFLSLVAEGRNKTVDEVHEVARGRIWSGEDALEQGLVDELGGLNQAIAKAKELAGIEGDTEVRLVQYPQRSGGFSFSGASASASELKAIGDLATLINDPEVQALIAEVEAAKSARLQARIPNYTER